MNPCIFHVVERVLVLRKTTHFVSN